MALLRCRECGQEINSNTRQTRCQGCGTLFPFACAVCERPLRPPFPVFSDERYLTEENEPLCPQHFQRQCPRCQNWFQADQNPGFFLCPECSAETAAEKTETSRPAPTPVARAASVPAEEEMDDDPEALLRATEQDSQPLLSLLGLFVWMLIIVLLFVLGRQLLLFLAPLFGG